MSATVSPRRSNPFLTPRLYGARKEFLEALTEVIATSNICPDQAEGLLSGLVCDLWNEAELLAQRALMVRELEASLVAPALRTQVNIIPTPSVAPSAVATPAPALALPLSRAADPPTAQEKHPEATLGALANAPSQAEDLGAYVQRIINEKGLSPALVAMRAERASYKISDETIRQVVNGSATNLTVGKLQALALGLGESLEALLFSAAGIRVKEACLCAQDNE
jgi:hypothetical protein